MTVPVSSITSRAATTLQDSGMTRWTQQELVDWADEGQLEVVRLWPDANRKVTEVTLVSGALQATPADCVSGFEVRRNAGGKAVLPFAKPTLDAYSPEWVTSTTGGPVKQFYFDAQTPAEFWVYPAQVAPLSTVEVSYGARPALLSPTGNLGIRDAYETNLLNYVLFRAYSKEGESNDSAGRAAAFYAAFSGATANK